MLASIRPSDPTECSKFGPRRFSSSIEVYTSAQAMPLVLFCLLLGVHTMQKKDFATAMAHPTLGQSRLSPALAGLVGDARSHFVDRFPESHGLAFCAAAPGRVNLIGEHTDYTGGFVLPLAIDFSTVVYGTGHISDSGKSGRSASIEFTSCSKPNKDVVSVTIHPGSSPPSSPDWTTYVVGTVFQYLDDLPDGCTIHLKFSIAGNVPLGSGLSSSASLEVAVASFIETILGTFAYSSTSDPPAKARALRCQKAENQWCQSPCGIMDQYVSSAAQEGALLLIDCRSLDYRETFLKESAATEKPVLVVANSNVKHDIAGGEYPVRVAQCKTATEALQKVKPSIAMLRDATLEDVESAESFMDDISYRRARHVVTENQRVLDAKTALEAGDWQKAGELMNSSHSSMRDDYEVSCEEVDVLVSLAQSFGGVYGSRLTGGGFGGCTVSLVKPERANSLISFLEKEYKAKTGKSCDCFVTSPAVGARLLGTEALP